MFPKAAAAVKLNRIPDILTLLALPAAYRKFSG
jgi:hypothetical protein